MSIEVERVKSWLEKIVIHHNFCPFAARPFKKDLIRYVLFSSQSDEALVDALIAELTLLAQTPAEDLETTVIIVSGMFEDFNSYNQFGGILDHLIESLKLKGVIQVATFHPDYLFAGLEPDDVRNYTNRSPYPLFHLIREDSVEKARLTYPDIEAIPERNMDKLEKIGLEKIKILLEDL